MLSARLDARRGSLRLSLELEAGPGPLAIIGPNGSGKSTLLLAVLGALPGVRGTLSLGGEILLDSGRQLFTPIEERRIAYVPQDYGLFPHLTVQANVAFGLPQLPADQRAERVRRALDDVGIGQLGERLPGQLSGGERQRVALARALAIRPRAILLDEPLAALDAPTQVRVRAFLAERLRRLAVPALVVTHDTADVLALGGPLLVLESGTVAQRGSPEAVRAGPVTAFARAFWSGEPL
ncbi:MAG TPA: ABC transporter ATP-binding protein [Myxococcaceae bacterium]|nr:ABC transporter ATP-binding protein [Myxococcaceae bacterium]